MIKKIWHIRNLYKLLMSLSVTICIFLLFYTTINILVMDENIELYLIGFDINTSKLFLIITPIIVALVVFIHKFAINKQLKKHELYINKNTKDDVLKISFIKQKFYVYSCLIITIILFFLQIDILNQAKKLQGFEFLPVIISAIIYILNILYTLFTIKTIKKEGVYK